MTNKVPDRMEERLGRAGLAPFAARAVLQIDALMQGWRRRMTKRELGLSALRELGLDLDLPQLDVLVAIAAPHYEFQGTALSDETMIGTVAERLNIDPSRASRLVSEMVDKGYVSRAASQTDSRRTVISLTEQGQAAVDAVRMHKFLRLGNFLSGWSQEDLETFLPLLERFSGWTEIAANPVPDPYHAEVEALARQIADAKQVKQPAE